MIKLAAALFVLLAVAQGSDPGEGATALTSAPAADEPIRKATRRHERSAVNLLRIRIAKNSFGRAAPGCPPGISVRGRLLS